MRARRKPDACELGGVSAGPRSVMTPGASPATRESMTPGYYPRRQDGLMRATYTALSLLECPQCRARSNAGQLAGTCACGSPLLARYDLELAAKLVTPADVAGRPPSLWRYHELLPVGAQERAVSFGEGMTPLVSLPRIGRAMGVPGLLMKDESPLPTATFKARGAAIGVSRAAELGAAGVAMPTNGNA